MAYSDLGNEDKILSDNTGLKLSFWERSELQQDRDKSGFYVAHNRGDEDDLSTLINRSPIQLDLKAVDAASSLYQRLPEFRDYHLQQYLHTHAQSASKQQPQVVRCKNPLYRRTQKNEIRVFELDPGERSHSLSGKLEYVDIGFMYPRQGDARRGLGSTTDFGISFEAKKKSTYTAISYCWGLAGMTETVTISGHHIEITPTVDTYLRILRHPTRTVRLWIDQICIDQTDAQDKQDQVQLMAQIYSRAFNTLIWLGEGPENGAFRLMQGIADSAFGRSEDLLDDELDFLRPVVGEHAAAYKALGELFSQPWFQRTWVVQEAILSLNTYIMYGSETISWQDFAGYCVDTMGFDIFALSDKDSAGSGWGIMGDIYSAKSMFGSFEGKPSLFTWLETTRYAAVTQPIDKVYGVMGLCESSIPIDYGRSVEDVYLDAARDTLKDCIAGTSDVDLARLLSSVDHDPTKSRLPSWVADWKLKRATSPLANKSFCQAYYKAGVSVKQQNISLSSDGRNFTVDLAFVDTVKGLSDVVTSAEISLQDLRASNSSLLHLIDFLNVNMTTGNLRIDYDTICAALVAGRDSTGMSAFSKDYVEVFSLLFDETTGKKPSVPNQTYSVRHSKGHFKISNLASRQPGRTFVSLKKAYQKAMLNRRLAWTEQGKLALVPSFATIGDRIVVIPDCAVPHVLRKRSNSDYLLIGECYESSIMDGTWLEKNRDRLETVNMC